MKRVDRRAKAAIKAMSYPYGNHLMLKLTKLGEISICAYYWKLRK